MLTLFLHRVPVNLHAPPGGSKCTSSVAAACSCELEKMRCNPPSMKSAFLLFSCCFASCTSLQLWIIERKLCNLPNKEKSNVVHTITLLTLLQADWSELIKIQTEKVQPRVRVCVLIRCFLFSQLNAEREFLINNVGVELLPLFLSPSLIAASKYQ